MTLECSRTSGYSPEDIKAEQEFIDQEELKARLERQCQAQGLRKLDDEADHKIFECINQAVKIRLQNMLDQILSISHQRRQTSGPGLRLATVRGVHVGKIVHQFYQGKDAIAFKGRHFRIDVASPRPKKLLAVLNKLETEREKQEEMQGVREGSLI